MHWMGKFLSALAATAAAAACARHPAPPASTRPAAAPVPVSTGEVVGWTGPIQSFVPASVHARERATLSARIPASVIALPHREGELVAAGALLVRLDDGALRAALAAAEASARAAEVDLQRTESLLAKGAATARELDDARTRAAAARAAVEAARDELAYAALRAPFAGRIVARSASLGDVVVPGRPLIELEGATGLELRASLESARAATLQVGQTLSALVDGQPQALPAIVRVVVASADPATHRFEVRADLPQTAGLRAGLFARLSLPAPAAEDRLLAPTRAVFRRGGLYGVFVVKEGRARLRWVAAGAAEGDRTEIRAGLEAGERVALDPGPLTDGAPVQEK
jgi:RND family efflux transporter MFP subunit